MYTSSFCFYFLFITHTIIPTLLHWPFPDLKQFFFSSSLLLLLLQLQKTNKNMEVTMELEDDLFFADLSKRISLLIMDDDDDEHTVSTCPSVSFQDVSRGNYSRAAISPLMYEQGCRRESKGTGVFIPRSSSQPRRKHRQGRHNSCNSNSHTHRHHQNSTSVSHQLPFNNYFRKANN